MALSEVIEVRDGMRYCLTSFLAFTTYCILLEFVIPTPEIILQRKGQVKYVNLVISTTHAFISAIWSLYCFYIDPDVVSDIINHSTVSTYLLCCFSMGYFIHDAVHYLRHVKFAESWEILLHHCVVVFCFGTAVVSHNFVNFSTVALLVEVNSVPLHTRTLLRMFKVPLDSSLYRINGVFNIVTYVFFRICVLGWMTRWLVLHYDAVQQPYVTIGSVGLFIMTIINVILFGRLLIKDNWIFARVDTHIKQYNTVAHEKAN